MLSFTSGGALSGKQMMRANGVRFACCVRDPPPQPMLLDHPIKSTDELPKLLKSALQYGVDHGLCSAGKEVVVLSSTNVAAGPGEHARQDPAAASDSSTRCARLTR